MEIYNNEFKVIFTNTAAAESAKQIAADAFSAMNSQDDAYALAKRYAASLRVEDNILRSDELCFFADGFMDAAVVAIKAIAENLKTESFTIDVCGCDTYAESWVDGNFENGLLSITSTYYPYGYCEFIPCPECGEDVVRIEDYDPSKTYVCPDCGEEVDLSKAYAEFAPVITKETIEIK